MTAVSTIARHAAAAALTADALYTIRYWLIGGRDDRRAGSYPVIKYFAIVGQLGIETALIIHLARTGDHTP